MTDISKDPGPEDPALVHPGGVEFDHLEWWNDGIVEYWGKEKKMY